MAKTVRVQYLTLSAGPEGVRRVGEIHEVPEAEARALIAARSAVEVASPVKPRVAAERAANEQAEAEAKAKAKADAEAKAKADAEAKAKG